MKKIRSALFDGISEDVFVQMEKIPCLRERSYSRGEMIFRMGDRTTELGIVISGSVVVENTDVWGNTGVLTMAQTGDVFAETYALCRLPMMVQVTAHEDCRVMFLDLTVLTAACDADMDWHRKMTENLLDISARKNIMLSERMFCISSKTVRGRVLAFLSGQARLAGSASFRIPYNRQQMADYLNVDRTALSRELGKMKEEGLIDFRKNEFMIYGFEEQNRYF